MPIVTTVHDSQVLDPGVVPMAEHDISLDLFATPEGVVAVGGDLSVARLQLAYRSGIFPWFNAGEPPIAPNRLTPLLTDAYAAQHFGKPSPQAINSVAVHLLALHAVFKHEFNPAKVQWVRLRALQNKTTPRHERFHWLTPPDFTDCLTVADIAAAATAEARGSKTAVFVQQVYTYWSDLHHQVLAQWYETYISG